MDHAPRSHTLLFVAALVPWLAGSAAWADQPPPTEFQARRQEIMKRLPDGILLLHSRSDLISNAQYARHAFHQDATFYYFTGLESAISVILAIDGPRKECWLFVPPPGLAGGVHRILVEPGADSESRLRLEHVKGWSEFAPYIDRRLAEDPKLVLYYEDVEDLWLDRRFASASPESNPPGLAPVDNRWLQWGHALQARWPHATLRSAAEVIQDLRLVKSPAEIEIMRRVGKASVAAGLAGLAATKPGRYAREVASDIVRGCLTGGASGPSQWPEASNRQDPDFDLANYHARDRQLRAGELVALDFGCEVDHYSSDVTRTAPVSGRFQPGQREVWDLFVRVYKAGLAAIRDGVRPDDVFAAAVVEVEHARANTKSPLAQKAVSRLLDKDARRFWLLHSSGIECCETEPAVLRAGMIVVFEPGLEVDGQAFGIEDMMLVKRDGYEVLTPLPYSAGEIERAMRRGAR